MRMRLSVSRLALAAGLAAIAGPALADTLSLDTITVLVTRTEIKAIESLAGVSVIGPDQIKQIDPARLQDIFAGVPSVIPVANADDPGVGFNIRGLQDYGRVAVIVDGARQNFQVAQHGPQGKTYLDTALISNVEVSRGPVSNIYGSGAIGGVVSMKTKDADDVLKPGERFGVLFEGTAGTNEGPLATSTFVAARPNESVDLMIGGSLKRLLDYNDGNDDKVANSGSDTGSMIAKATFRPAEGHELKLGYMLQRFWFDSGTPADPALLGDGGTNYGNAVETDTLTAQYNYKSPDNKLIDFELSGYWGHTKQTTTVKEQLAYCLGDYDENTGVAIPTDYPNCIPPAFNPGLDFTGPVGTMQGFDLTSAGFDTHNNAQFDAFGLQNTLTIGGDYFNDDIKSTGSSTDLDAGYQMTGSGTRQAYGAFAQWLAEYGSWLDVIGAARYDGFDLKSADTDDHSQGSRVSPKLTVGVTPLTGFTLYGTYAEGYRAPTVSEAFAAGAHPGNIFLFLPNPSLKPEVGKTLEAGINLNYNNLLTANDAFRLKADVFRNNVTNYIGLIDMTNADGCSFPGGAFYFGGFGDNVCYQYQNIARARIDGVELEGTYDAGDWFAMASGSYNKGEDLDSGEALEDVAEVKTYVSAGVRFLDRKLTVAPNWQYVKPSDDSRFDAYNLFGLTVGWQPTEDVRAAVVFNNLANTMYTPFLGDSAGPGFSVKGTLTVRLGMK